MTRLRLVVTVLAVVALAVPAFVGSSTADHPHRIPCVVPGLLCPDLITDGTRFNPYLETRTFSTNSCDVQEGHTEPGTRKLLRFRFTTPNVGVADLVVGRPDTNYFEWGSCHGHWHFKEYADYRLWEPAQFAQYEALRLANPGVQAHEILEAHPELKPVRGDKRGFCVIDIIRYAPAGLLPKYQSCNFQGISVGWADEYYFTLSGQYIDVTGLPSGNYVLEAEVNSEQLYEESNYDNNRASVRVTI
ncbi:MAG TPA: lysyl oxidase family protein [Candidatus Thermoplasmatota archaeon]|nr:lysyl oxidase family protein [Candidatus Thermoplasmatota archaeon]